LSFHPQKAPAQRPPAPTSEERQEAKETVEEVKKKDDSRLTSKMRQGSLKALPLGGYGRSRQVVDSAISRISSYLKSIGL
jgi:hypothetical protein